MSWRGHLRTPSGWVAAVSLLVALVAVVVSSSVALFALRDDAPWNPLGPYPIQTVEGTGTTVVGGVTFPSVTLNDQSVIVRGEKCFKEPVTVSGRVSWSSTVPPGLAVQVGDGTADRDTGCFRFQFTNEIPLVVKTWAGERFRRGDEAVLVQISGREVATADGHGESLPLTWRTEVFAILRGDT